MGIFIRTFERGPQPGKGTIFARFYQNIAIKPSGRSTRLHSSVFQVKQKPRVGLWVFGSGIKGVFN